MKTIAIPNATTYIAEDAFEGCDSLTTVYAPKGSYAEAFFQERYPYVRVERTRFDPETSFITSYGVRNGEAYMSAYVGLVAYAVPETLNGYPVAEFQYRISGSELRVDRKLFIPPNMRSSLASYDRAERPLRPIWLPSVTTVDGVTSDTASFSMLPNAQNLFDGSVNTKWSYTFYDGGYASWKMNAPTAVTGYTITVANENDYFAGGNPRCWTLYGRNGASDAWHIIDCVENDTKLQDMNNKPCTFALPEPSPEYQEFKLEINDVYASRECFMEIAEFALLSTNNSSVVLGENGQWPPILDGITPDTPAYPGQSASSLFDGMPGTKWCFDFQGSASVTWMEDAPMAVAGYTMTTAYDNSVCPGRNPRDWTLYGRNGESDEWHVIDRVEFDTVLEDVDLRTFTFMLPAPSPEYTEFKLEITAIAGGDENNWNTMQLGNFELLGPGQTPPESVADDETQALASFLAAIGGAANTGANDEQFNTPVAAPIDIVAATDAPIAPSEPQTDNGIATNEPGYPGEEAGNLFDGMPGTKWCFEFKGSAFVSWAEGAPVAVAGYTLTTANDNAGFPGRNPSSWTLYGRNGELDAWHVIDRVENDTVLQDMDFQPFTFMLPEPSPEYAEFQLEIDKIAGNDRNVMQLSEIALITDGR